MIDGFEAQLSQKKHHVLQNEDSANYELLLPLPPLRHSGGGPVGRPHRDRHNVDLRHHYDGTRCDFQVQ